MYSHVHLQGWGAVREPVMKGNSPFNP
jgi:hypothetical protein